MKIARPLLVTFFFMVLLTMGSIPVSAEGADPAELLHTNEDGDYEVRIEASQWEFVAYDMVQVAELEAEGKSTDEAMEIAHYKHRIGTFEKKGHLKLSVVSSDVQHGFALNELDILIATNRPEVGSKFGAPVFWEGDLPNEDVTYSGFCHIFCGLGHPDMKMKFVIGLGSPETGRYVYWAVIAINAGIFGYFLYRLITKIKLIPKVEAAV
ncbi:MAG: hypothetical protein GPJ54_19010 [Candidatus Heimdallarchaeota archaeon]|nr:hypothetical protein [Candidatus Heimdallarchaeota archaeon]